MKRITDQKLKPVIIVCCCLCITIINCDKMLIEKRSIYGSNIEKSKLNTVLSQTPQPLVALLPPNSVSQHSSVQKNQTVKIVPKNNPSDREPDVQHLTSKTSITNNSTKSNLVNSEKNTTSASTNKAKPGISPNMQPPMNTGALLRGTSVFLGLSIVVIAYIMFRCLRLNKNRTQMVRKYGVLAHRQDVEMRPLPLDDEDEDDTTVFDASEVAAIHDKQPRMST